MLFLKSALRSTCAFTLAVGMAAPAAADKIDASDPTKIYTYAGGGVKYTDYTNGESMTELRATGNVGVSANDMVLFEFGYGWHSGDAVPGSNDRWTDARVRWFHLFSMDYAVTHGYRGTGTQLDLQLAGDLKGTNGQNVVTLGLMPAFGLGKQWSLILGANFVNSWDKKFEQWNGAGAGIAPLFVFAPDDWWAGAYVQIWPNYTYFFTGDLAGKGSGTVDLVTGGQITKTTLWGLTLQKQLDQDLGSFRRGRDTGLQNDWNVFFNITTYF